MLLLSLQSFWLGWELELESQLDLPQALAVLLFMLRPIPSPIITYVSYSANNPNCYKLPQLQNIWI